MLKHILAGCLTGLILAIATWSFLPAQQAQTAPEAPRRGLSDKAYLGITFKELPDKTLELTQVYPATPAWDAGLVAGDIILGVELITKKQPSNELAPAAYMLMGLATAAPGTEFKMKIHRGDTSLNIEEAFCQEFPKREIEIPAARTFIEHIQKAMQGWNHREQVWVTVKSCSFKEFSDFHMREQQIELVRTQMLELQVRMQKEEAETQLAYQNIKTLIAQQKLAEAQSEVARLEQMKSGFGLLQLLFGLFRGIFGF